MQLVRKLQQETEARNKGKKPSWDEEAKMINAIPSIIKIQSYFKRNSAIKRYQKIA